MKELAAFIAVPLAFLVALYSIIYVIGRPIIVPLQAIATLMTNTDGKTVSDNYADSDYLSTLVTSSNGVETIKASGITLPTYGEKYAHISVTGTDVDCDVFFGDSNEIMRYGAGQYIGSSFPGFGGSILIAAHKTTYFMDLKNAKIGSVITLQTTYGVYTYTITDMQILDPADYLQIYNPDATEENLVIYTCYPFNMLGFSKQRYFVKAEYTSGPQVNIYE